MAPYLGGDAHLLGPPRLMGWEYRGSGDRGLRTGAALGMSTGAAVISWPSIWPPSMCFMAFSASSGSANSMYPYPLLRVGLMRLHRGKISNLF